MRAKREVFNLSDDRPFPEFPLQIYKPDNRAEGGTTQKGNVP